MKTRILLSTLFILILYSGVKSQALCVNGRFISSTNKRLRADYTLSCEGKVLCQGKDREELFTRLTMNKVYMLEVKKEGFKNKTILFSLTPEPNTYDYVFEFEVCLKEKYYIQNIEVSNNTVIEYNYNCKTNKSTLISNENTRTKIITTYNRKLNKALKS